jgi:hypothetical protein
MTFFDDVGESTCKLLPLKLGSAYVGNKRVASEGKSKGVPRKGIVRATKEGTTRGVIKGVAKEVDIEGVVREGAIEEGNCLKEKEV